MEFRQSQYSICMLVYSLVKSYYMFICVENPFRWVEFLEKLSWSRTWQRCLFSRSVGDHQLQDRGVTDENLFFNDNTTLGKWKGFRMTTSNWWRPMTWVLRLIDGWRQIGEKREDNPGHKKYGERRIQSRLS